ncbi:MAG: putative ATP-grasp-modified RiPP [Pseudonocardiaceae bacterium]
MRNTAGPFGATVTVNDAVLLALAEPDSLEPGLLPADPYWLEVSQDVPSAPGVRPFGLTCTTPVPEEKIVISAGLSYDPVRQITVDADGVPAIYPTGRRQATHSRQTTKEDGQTWSDHPVDD